MRSSLAILALLVVGLVAVVLLARSRTVRAEEPSSEPDPAAMSAALRAQLLDGSASAFSIQPEGPVWGVLMETGYGDAAATLVALADGTASLYYSSGGGVIGGGEHDDVAEAARRIVTLSVSQLPGMSPTSAYPLPSDGRVKFYVLTTEGVVTAEAAEDELGAGNHALSRLFFGGHEVISGLREISESPRSE